MSWEVKEVYSSGSWSYISPIRFNISFRRALFFGYLSTVSYIAMLLYLMYVDDHPISLVQELPKVTVIYVSNLYIAVTARTSVQYRIRTAAAVRVARELILQLNKKSR